MTATFHMTHRTISLEPLNHTLLEVRTFTSAVSAGAARVESRPEALAAVSGVDGAQIVGREFVISVPGVNSYRPPEVRVRNRWLKVYGLPPIPSDASLKKHPITD
ncbi:MAG: hypothetical protein Q8Q84_18380 [Hydrogenophaga sp.]|nr:hypothetical protein [Hydrogenophaga sp.]